MTKTKITTALLTASLVMGAPIIAHADSTSIGNTATRYVEFVDITFKNRPCRPAKYIYPDTVFLVAAKSDPARNLTKKELVKLVGEEAARKVIDDDLDAFARYRGASLAMNSLKCGAVKQEHPGAIARMYQQTADAMQRIIDRDKVEDNDGGRDRPRDEDRDRDTDHRGDTDNDGQDKPADELSSDKKQDGQEYSPLTNVIASLLSFGLFIAGIAWVAENVFHLPVPHP